MRTLKAVIAASALAIATSASADIQPLPMSVTDFNFDVISFDGGTAASSSSTDRSYPYSATGTSNGIAWSVSANSLYEPLTTSNGGYTGFSALDGQATDRLHLGYNFEIEFEENISSLLVVVNNDNKTDSFNFGPNLTASSWSGLQYDSVTGQTTLDDKNGGWILFDNINTNSFIHTNNNGVNDGYNVAFHAVSAVPEPSTYALMLGGLGLVGFMAARRRKLQA